LPPRQGIDEADIAREIMNKFGNLTAMANEFSFFKDEPGSEDPNPRESQTFVTLFV